MSDFRKFPSIEQFRNVIRDVAYDYKTEAMDPLPTLTFKGTVKLHGTNACVAYNHKTRELFVQKRTGKCNPENDNFGVATWVESTKQQWIEFFQRDKSDVLKPDITYIYGEWCGGNIQKGVAIAGLPKMFVVFRTIEVADVDGTAVSAHDRIKRLPEIDNVYHIDSFGTYIIDIDFNNPKIVQNDLIKLTEAVEAECPVGKHFGVSGIGEGIVWTNNQYCFKVKGEKHSVSKVKVLVEVDVEKLKTVNEFLDRAVTENRMLQGIEMLQQDGKGIDIRNMGAFLSWMFADIVKEEADVIEASGLEKREYSKGIAQRAKQWYIDKCNKAVGL